LFRPIEFACPPGIHVLLLISGLRALFFRIGDSEPRELSTPKVGARGGTDAVRSGMRYVGTFGTFLTAVLVGLSLTFGLSSCLSIAFLAFELRCDLVVFSMEPLFRVNLGGVSSLLCKESPTTFLVLFLLLMGPFFTISGSVGRL